MTGPSPDPGSWTVSRLGGALGARVDGVDLARLDGAGWRRVDELFAEHHVLAFAGQSLSPDEHVAIGEHFGDPYIHPFLEAVPEHPAILQVLKEPEETATFGGEHWHVDISFTSPPAATSVLYGLEIPPVGGDTLFANQHMAYDTLSASMQRFLDGLMAVHRYPDRAESSETAAEHPMVRVHPVTGRKALYVNAAFTVRIEGLAAAESRTLLDFLFAHQVHPDFTARVPWTRGQLVIWDNRSVQHYAMNDYAGHRRRLHRVTAIERA